MLSPSYILTSALCALSLSPSVLALPATNVFSPSATTQSHCRCISISSTQPQSSSLFLEASRSTHWHCAELGPKLEYWRRTNPDDFRGAWRELFGDDEEESLAPSAPTSALHDLKPLPTGVLLELAARKGEEGGDEKIICRARSEGAFGEQHGSDETQQDEWTDRGLAIVGVLVVVVVLSCIAELMEMMFVRYAAGSSTSSSSVIRTNQTCRFNIFSWRNRHSIRLSGGERFLRAEGLSTIQEVDEITVVAIADQKTSKHGAIL